MAWTVQFCRGMAYAQLRGVVVHRDIKPANLMLMPDNELRITDFGLARSFALPSGAVEPGRERRAVSGTLPYMAPEQILSPGEIDHRADIYAFGITLYELIAGRRPFREQSDESLITDIVHEAPRTLDSPLWEICQKCIQKRPSARYQRFDELMIAAQRVGHQLGLRLPEPSAAGPDDDRELLYARAISYGEMGRGDLAKKFARKYCQSNPDDSRGWTELGKQYLADGQPEKCMEASIRAVRLAPFASVARNNLGIALARLGRHEEAVDQLRVAASHDPLNTGALLNQAGSLVKLKRPADAIQVMLHASRIAPDKASVWANLGAVQMEAGEEVAAERSLERALALHPGLHEAQQNLDQLKAMRVPGAGSGKRPDAGKLLAEGRIREAESVLLDRVASDARDVDAWHDLGLIAAHERRDQEAIRCYRQVTAIRPNDEFARKQLIRLISTAGDIDGALCECAELARIPRERVTAAAVRAQLLQAKGEGAVAIRELRQLVHADANLDQIWFVLSEIYEREGNLFESLQAAKRNLTVLHVHGGLADNISMVEQRIASLEARIRA